MAQLLGAAENGEEGTKDQEPASKDKDVSDLDQLLKSERKREKEEMELPPPVSCRFCHGLVRGCLHISFSDVQHTSHRNLHLNVPFMFGTPTCTLISSRLGRRGHRKGS